MIRLHRSVSFSSLAYRTRDKRTFLAIDAKPNGSILSRNKMIDKVATPSVQISRDYESFACFLFAVHPLPFESYTILPRVDVEQFRSSLDYSSRWLIARNIESIIERRDDSDFGLLPRQTSPRLL